MAELVLEFAADHPAANGHFPGNPVIPGAFLLGETLRTITTAVNGGLVPVEIDGVKFLNPVRPGDRVAVTFATTGDGVIRFSCTVEGKSVMVGTAKCRVAK